jgi:hypothetical protein
MNNSTGNSNDVNQHAAHNLYSFPESLVQPPQLQDRVAILPTKAYFNDDGTLNADPQMRTMWTAQPVLQWLESLASASEGCGSEPVIIDGTRLSDPTPLPSTNNSGYDFSSPIPFNLAYNNKPKHWDLTYIQHHDPNSWTSVRQIEAMACLVEEKRNLATSYHAIQTLLKYLFGRIMEQPSRSVDERQFLLNALYQDTISKLSKLIENDGKTQLTPDVPKLISTQQNQKKKDFSDIMTGWLLDNWTNPYPDDDGLAGLAAETDTTPTIVGNWLINARTRKWRPAIIKATQNLDRPASLLLEDSINIFVGNPLREYNEDESDMCASDLLSLDAVFYPSNKRYKPSI